jgi:hypothetical protein
VELLRAFLVLISLYPLAVLPVMVAHAYSTGNAIDAGLLFLIPEGSRAPGEWRSPRPHIDPAYPYFAILLLASAAANVRVPWFYAGLSLLCAWALWAARPKRASVLVWGALLGCACLLGYVGHHGLSGLQRVLQGELTSWLSDSMSILLKQGHSVRCVRLGSGDRRYDIGNFPTYFKAFIDLAIADEKYGYTVRQYLTSLALEL